MATTQQNDSIEQLPEVVAESKTRIMVHTGNSGEWIVTDTTEEFYR